jgi:peroxiredoxin Q/BCP
MAAARKQVSGAKATTDLSGQSREVRTAASAAGFQLLLALVFIYLVLAAQFESFIDPIVILLAVPLASDEDGRISEAFGTWVEKSMYGRKYMGMERATFLIGADGKVNRAWRKVKVPGHAEDVLKAAS